MTDEPQMVKYLVTAQAGEFVIELPAEWKLTFGAVNPGAPPHARDLHCLRIYDGANAKTSHLRGVITDVRGFRDLSIPFARKIEKQTGAAEWTRDDLGNFESSSRRQIEQSWDRNGQHVEDPF